MNQTAHMTIRVRDALAGFRRTLRSRQVRSGSMRLIILTPEYDGAGGGIMTYYRALAPALCAAGVELRVIEGSALYSAEDRAERTCGGVQIETLERARLDRWQERFPSPLWPRRVFVVIWPPLGRCGSRRATARGATSWRLVTGAFCLCRPQFKRHGRWSCNVMAASVRSLSVTRLPAKRRKAFLYASSSAPPLRLPNPFRPPAEPTLPSGTRRPGVTSR